MMPAIPHGEINHDIQKREIMLFRGYRADLWQTWWRASWTRVTSLPNYPPLWHPNPLSLKPSVKKLMK